MKRFLTALLLLACAPLPAAEWLLLKDTVSPDKKLGLAVLPSAGEGQDTDAPVFLIDVPAGRRIGPLEEVISDGGGWGRTTDNVTCHWSPDSRLLLVNFRIGRLMHTYQIYRIKGRRAVPIELPAETPLPKARVRDLLEKRTNGGAWANLLPDGRIETVVCGFDWKHGVVKEDFTSLGFDPDVFVDQNVQLVYLWRRGKDGTLVLDDFTAREPK